MVRFEFGRAGRIATAVVAVGVLVLGVVPRPLWAVSSASAGSVKIQATVVGFARHVPPGCGFSILISTYASFDQPVRFDEVQLRIDNAGPIAGAPLHRYDTHSPRGATADSFNWTYSRAAIPPGTYKLEAIWSAHNGNGFSRGSGKATGELTVPSPVTMGKLDGETKCQLQRQADAYNLAASKFGAAGDAVRAACPTCTVAMYEVALAYIKQLEDAQDMANDPPDPNFTTLPVAAPVAMPVVNPGGPLNAEGAAALNDLLRLMGEASGKSKAALSAIEKAQGAHMAADKTWEERQTVAAAGFLKELAAVQGQLSTAMNLAGTRLKAAGFPNPAIDRAAIDAFLASSAPSWLREQGGRDEAKAGVLMGMLYAGAQEVTTSVPLLDLFSAPEMAQALAANVAALNAMAAALIADPMVIYSEETVAPSPSPSVKPSPRPTVAEQPSLLANSGFEEPALDGVSYETLIAGKPKTLANWRITKGSIDVVTSGGGLAATGGQFIDLNGNDTAAGPGTITQEIKVTSGRRYRLSFQLAGNPNGDPPLKTVEVVVGGSKQKFTFDTKGRNNNELGWTTYSMEGCSGGGSTLGVTFKSLTEGIRGPNLDNVVLADIGEGSCWTFPIWLAVIGAIIIAAAVVAFVYWRRRRGSQVAAEVPHEVAADGA